MGPGLAPSGREARKAPPASRQASVAPPVVLSVPSFPLIDVVLRAAVLRAGRRIGRDLTLC
jgi:hypothetical protein